MCLFAAEIGLLNVSLQLQTTKQIFKVLESEHWGFEFHWLKIQEMSTAWTSYIVLIRSIKVVKY